jgi:outer membrane receptor protein involved in Fe transport
MRRKFACFLAFVALAFLLSPAAPAWAQGVTTSAVTGIVKDAQGAVIPGATVSAVHVPSGSTYEAVSQGDGRFTMQGMRIGGPYTLTASLAGFRSEVHNNVSLALGVTQDVSFTLAVATVAETVDVVAESSPIFSSTRTGAATAVTREELATLPTVSGRINDITRLTPQYGGNGTFAGQDNRMNNITVDGSYFNNSFGIGGQPGDRTGVAPISLEAIEQIQVSVAPYDVRQGNFVGAGVNMVTRSGTNRLIGSFYSRYRNNSFVGTEAAGLPYNPGTFTTKTNGGFVGAPIVRNRLFVFGSFEKQVEARPLSSFLPNDGTQAVAGNTTRVLRSDLDTLSAFLKSKYGYDPGTYGPVDKNTPAKPFLIKFDYNLNTSNKVNFRFSRLDSSTDVLVSGSQSAGRGRGANSTNWLGFSNSNYQILENIKSGIGEWSSVLGSTMSNSLTVGYTTNNESRNNVPAFPFVDILDGNGVAYTSFGPDPFTRNNELYYQTFQAQNTFTKLMNAHTFTFGVSIEKYHSDNVFYQLANGVYTYNSLADFYAAANGGTVNLNRYQLAYVNVPGLEKPLQQLDPWYIGGYAQDQFRLRDNVTVTAGLRVDTPSFKQTGFDNPNANALTFRDEDGNPVQYNSGKLPGAKPLWSPRVGFNWDVERNQSTQIRGGTGIFTGKPAYVWISNQIGNTGLLLGRIDESGSATAPLTNRPFNPDPDAYRPAVSGAPATSYELNVTDPDFKFPQTWRSNIGVDRKLPWGIVGTAEFIYNRDLNGIYYINANLPQAQSSFPGLDNRPRWVGPTCAGAGQVGGCVTRINNDPGNIVTAAYVIKNQDVGRSWIASGMLSKQLSHGLTLKGAYSHGVSRNTVDAGSTASGTWTTNAQVNGANTPGLSFSTNSPGHRLFINASYSKEYFSFGGTTVSAYWEARTNSTNFATNASYVFAGDMNGDSASNNDLIYVPKDTSEMSFVEFTAGTGAAARTFTVAEQVAAFEAYINQDPYLSKRRGQYAERNGLFLPLVKRMDLAISQDIFHSIKGARHSGQIRLDVLNLGNLLNSKWGAGQRPVISSASSSLNLIPLLTNATVNANNTLTYRMALVNNALPTTTFQTTTFSSDVYTMMLSFRYNFN